MKAYCRQCNYWLRGDDYTHCPECGCDVDLNDATTFLPWPGYKQSRIAGTSLAVFGGVEVLLHCGLCFLTDRLIISVAGIVFFCLGMTIRDRGSRRAAKWAMGCLLVSMIFSLLVILTKDPLSFASWVPMSHRHPLIVSGIGILWGFVNAWFVWRFLAVESDRGVALY